MVFDDTHRLNTHEDGDRQQFWGSPPHCKIYHATFRAKSQAWEIDS